MITPLPARWPLIPLALALLLVSCSESAAPPSTPTTVSGTVVDAGGSPVNKAEVGLIFTFEKSTLDTLFTDTFLLAPYPNPVINNAVVGFEVPTPGRVHADLLRYGTRDTARHLLDELLETGLHQLSTSYDGLPNGGYIYLSDVNGTKGEMLTILNDPDTVNFTPLLTTDADGRFTLQRSQLPVGQTISRSFETGQWGGYVKVAPRVGIVVRRPSGGSRVEWITVDENDLGELTLRP